MEHDMTAWAEIAKTLADRETFQDPEVGLRKKRKYIRRFLPELQDGIQRRVLDIGAGTGSFCHVCQELGHEALAVLSNVKPNMPSSIAYKKACSYYGVPSIGFTWGSEPADLEDESFDVVNSQGMIGDNDPELWPAMFDDMFRVLKPGGILLIAANHESGTEHMNVINEWAQNIGATRIGYWRDKTVWKFKK